jgi:hypothetical protein
MPASTVDVETSPRRVEVLRCSMNVSARRYGVYRARIAEMPGSARRGLPSHGRASILRGASKASARHSRDTRSGREFNIYARKTSTHTRRIQLLSHLPREPRYCRSHTVAGEVLCLPLRSARSCQSAHLTTRNYLLAR